MSNNGCDRGQHNERAAHALAALTVRAHPTLRPARGSRLGINLRKQTLLLLFPALWEPGQTHVTEDTTIILQPSTTACAQDEVSHRDESASRHETTITTGRPCAALALE